MTDLSLAQECLRLSVAAGLGAAIGLERELRAQPAGLRTHLLVSLGAALFTVVGATVPGTDPGRVAAQVVAGIGFLGAGAILRQGLDVHGLTTAASLWITAAIGLACGFGRPGLAVFAVGVAIVALTVLRWLEADFFPRSRGHRVVLEIADDADLARVVREATGVLGARVQVTSLEHVAHDRSTVTLVSPLQKGFALLDLAGRLRAVDGVTGVALGTRGTTLGSSR